MDKKELKITIIGILIFFSLAALYSYKNYIEIQEDGIYAIGEIIGNTYHKGYRGEVSFKFFVNKEGEKEYGVQTTPIFSDISHSLIEGKKFLVIYSERNPKNNIMVFGKPIINRINLDSINQIGIDLKDIDYWEL